MGFGTVVFRGHRMKSSCPQFTEDTHCQISMRFEQDMDFLL